MNGPERKSISGWLWGGLAVLTCPCHLPILAVVLARTTAGAFLGEHWVIAARSLAAVTDEIIDLHGRILDKLFNAAKNKHQQQSRHPARRSTPRCACSAASARR